MTPTVRSATVGAARSRPSVASMEKHGIAKAALLRDRRRNALVGPAGSAGPDPSAAAMGGRAARARRGRGAASTTSCREPNDRTERRPLIGRIVSGAIAGGIVARVADASVALGVAIGALAALGSTFYFHRARAEAARRVPPLAAAIGGGFIAVEAARVAMRRLPRAR